MSIASVVLEDDTETPALVRQIRNEVGTIIAKAYPGYDWYVDVHNGNGVCDVKCMSLDGTWGFRFFLDRYASWTDLKADLTRGCGELLERYHARRAAMNAEEILSLPVDIAGRTIGEKT